MHYDEELPIEEYIYNEPLKERHEDISRFKQLIDLNDSTDEDAATELLYISKRLFYNQHGLDIILNARNTVLNFFDVDTDDDTIPTTMNGNIKDHDDLIDEILNAMDDIEELKKMNIKKLCNKYPEVPFLTLIKIVLMELTEEPSKKILKQLEDALSIYPDDILLQLEQDAIACREGKTAQFINHQTLNQRNASSIFNNRKAIHSYELMSINTALYEYFVSQNDLIMLDALMFASQTLYPEWEDAWTDKELYSEILKVQFCKLLVMEK